MKRYFIVIYLFNFFTTALSHWDFPHGKSGLLSPGKASCDSHATQPILVAGYFSVSIIYRTLTWTTASFDVHTDVNACVCARGCTDTVTESALKVDWKKNPLPHQGIKPASAACWSDAVPTHLQPHSRL